ncbi:MAG: NAD(P)-binding domain-containing protein, partial [bacterium]
MQLAIIGLGRMGGNMTERLLRAGHEVVPYARRPEALERFTTLGAHGVTAFPTLMERVSPPRTIWMMIPAGNPVDQTIETLGPLLAHGDGVVDGGNSFYKDTIRRAALLREHGLH